MGRSPYGERGLKSDVKRRRHDDGRGRSPYGERGLKSISRLPIRMARGRSPYGERGLKLSDPPGLSVLFRSLSLRRAWIEMLTRTGRSTM